MSIFAQLVFASLSALGLPVVAVREDPAPAQKQKIDAPPVYDEQADARADVKAALARARKDNKRVLIQWGANWCSWCKLLHGTMKKDGDVSKELLYEYEVVRVDVGRFDKHIDFAKELGAEFTGIPFLTVLDANGQALAQNDTTEFETHVDDKPGHDPKKLLAFLAQHQPAHLDANVVRDAAFARAKSEGKRVFLHFGAPWCGWCHKLEDWMARPEIAALLDKEFVDLKIDTDRMSGGKEMLAAERSAAGVKAEGGIPWMVFFDANGKALANSDGPKGNTGFPSEDFEIAHFATMLETGRVKLTTEDIAALRESLAAIHREAEARRKAQQGAK